MESDLISKQIAQLKHVLRLWEAELGLTKSTEERAGMLNSGNAELQGVKSQIEHKTLEHIKGDVHHQGELLMKQL